VTSISGGAPETMSDLNGNCDSPTVWEKEIFFSDIVLNSG